MQAIITATVYRRDPRWHQELHYRPPAQTSISQQWGHILQTALHCDTKHEGLALCSPALYLQSNQTKSQLTDQPLYGLSWLSSVPPGNCLGHRNFQYITHLMPYTLAIYSVIKQSMTALKLQYITDSFSVSASSPWRCCYSSILTNKPTNSRSSVLTEKLTVPPHLVKKFPIFY
jgi:hypothetical protein